MQQWLLRARRHRQTVSLVVLALLWLPAFHVWWIAPGRAALAERRAALADRQHEIGALRAAAAQLAALEKSAPDAPAGRQAAGPRLAGGDSAALLRRVESLAREAGIALMGFEPQPPLALDTHSEWPVRLALEGAYPDLLRLLARLTDCATGLAADVFTLRAAADTGAESAGAVRAEVTVAALALPAAPGDPPRPAAAAVCPALDAYPADGPAAAADPFAALPAAAEPLPEQRPPGLAGVRVSELTLQGLVQSAAGPLAVVAAPGGETYMLRGGERLLDGAVAAVQADRVVLRDAGQRTVHRTLAGTGAGR